MKIYGVLLLALLAACSNEPPVAADKPTRITPIDTPILPHQPRGLVPVDISPMDVAYLPADYPVRKMSGKAEGLPVARVIYSRPHRQGRTIFGELVRYGEPWRLGANEATELEFFRPVQIQGKQIPAGRYVIYAIPTPERWVIILNDQLYSWGLKQDRSGDRFQFEIPANESADTEEYFTMAFEKTASGADLVMAWENKIARLPIKF